jgi:integrase
LREQLRQKQASINYHLKKLGKELGIKGVLTMYVARHSWASIAKQMNIPLNVISDGMGHTSEKTTQVYLTTIDADRIDAANEEIIHSVISSGK